MGLSMMWMLLQLLCVALSPSEVYTLSDQSTLPKTAGINGTIKPEVLPSLVPDVTPAATEDITLYNNMTRVDNTTLFDNSTRFVDNATTFDNTTTYDNSTMSENTTLYNNNTTFDSNSTSSSTAVPTQSDNSTSNTTSNPNNSSTTSNITTLSNLTTPSPTATPADTVIHNNTTEVARVDTTAAVNSNVTASSSPSVTVLPQNGTNSSENPLNTNTSLPKTRVIMPDSNAGNIHHNNGRSLALGITIPLLVVLIAVGGFWIYKRFRKVQKSGTGYLTLEEEAHSFGSIQSPTYDLDL